MCSRDDQPPYDPIDTRPYVPPHYPCGCELCNCYARVPERGPCARCRVGNHVDRPTLPDRPQIEYRRRGGRTVAVRPPFVRDLPRQGDW